MRKDDCVVINIIINKKSCVCNQDGMRHVGGRKGGGSPDEVDRSQFEDGRFESQEGR